MVIIRGKIVGEKLKFDVFVMIIFFRFHHMIFLRKVVLFSLDQYLLFWRFSRLFIVH